VKDAYPARLYLPSQSNLLKLCKPMIDTLKPITRSPPYTFNSFPKSDQVTHRFLRGRFALLNENFVEVWCILCKHAFSL
jgi:hypothetical protein